jgi:hypothetical protein
MSHLWSFLKHVFLSVVCGFISVFFYVLFMSFLDFIPLYYVYGSKRSGGLLLMNFLFYFLFYFYFFEGTVSSRRLRYSFDAPKSCGHDLVLT